MSLLRDVLKLVCGLPPKQRPGPSQLSISVPLPLNGTGHVKVPRPSRPRQTKPPRHPEGLTAQQLHDALGLASKISVVRPSLPILACCLLQKGNLQVTDLENSLTLALPGLDIESVCVPVALLRKVLRTMKGPVQLGKHGLDVVVNDTFTLPGLDPQEFPASPARAAQEQIDETFLVPERWADLLPAVSPDETRLNLSGVCIDLAAGYCVSSDGHRVQALQIPAGTVETQGIVALPAAKLIARLLSRGAVTGQWYTQRLPLPKEQEELGAVESSDVIPESVRHQRERLEQARKRPASALFRTPGVELWTRLVEGEFPDYRQVLQRPAKLCHATMPRPLLTAALKACLACAPKDRLGVSLTRLPAGVRVRLEATDNGSVDRLVECRGWRPGRYVGLNARYLLQALEGVRSAEVTLALKDEASPVHIADEDLYVVISPLRVLEPTECQQDKQKGGVPEQSDETAKASQAK